MQPHSAMSRHHQRRHPPFTTRLDLTPAQPFGAPPVGNPTHIHHHCKNFLDKNAAICCTFSSTGYIWSRTFLFTGPLCSSTGWATPTPLNYICILKANFHLLVTIILLWLSTWFKPPTKFNIRAKIEMRFG